MINLLGNTTNLDLEKEIGLKQMMSHEESMTVAALNLRLQ